MKNHEKYAAEISAALANAAYGPCGVQEMTLQTYLESGCVADFPDCETCPVHLQGVCPGYDSTVAPDPDRVAEWLNAEVTELMERKAFVTRWRKMLKLQAKLDERIVQGNGITYKDLLEGNWYVSAILDELGELNHELKADWCWWKKTQAPVDDKKVLEEFVDVLHFVLSWQLAHHEVKGTPLSVFTNRAFTEYDTELLVTEDRRIVSGFQPMMYHLGVSDTYPPVSQLMWLMRCLKLDFEDVYQAYLEKNAENHARQDRGY